MKTLKPGGRTTSKRRKTKLFNQPRPEQSLNPPTLPVHIGQAYDFAPYASLFRYTHGEMKEFAKIDPKDLSSEIKTGHVNWINIEGLHDITFIQEIAKTFDLHALTVEDIVNTSLRPQFESFPGYSFFALEMLYTNADGLLTQEHVSFVLCGNVLLTFQEKPGDVWERIRERIRGVSATICSRGADYLLYLLMDSIVDGYYRVIDDLGEKIDDIEESLQLGPRDELLKRTFELRREILFLRKNILPVRDLFNKAQVSGTVFQANTQVYLKDLSDHIIQVTESLGLSMEMSNVLIDTYHSMQNQRLNQVMKTLTMISTIFLPLNFIAGIYGMNFEHMPELKWVHGYPLALSAMATVVCVMVIYFGKKGWLHNERPTPVDESLATPKS